MALAIDGSSPAVAVQTSSTIATVATASFTPPAGALLLIGWAGNTGSASDPGAPSITDSLGVHITYTQIGWKHRTSPAPTVDGQAAMWWGVVGSSAAMTVTVTTGTGSGARAAALKVWVITGQDVSTPISTTAKGATGSTSAGSIAQAYTATASAGWGFLAVCDWDLKGAQTAGTGCTVDGSANILSDITYAFARRTTADDSNGVSNTLNTTLPATSTNLSWVYAEVQPAAAAAGSAVSAAQITSGAPRRTAGQAIVTRPVAEPSPLQNQPIPALLVVAGRPGAAAGSTLLLAARAEPATANPPCPEPFMSIGRAAQLAAAVTVLTPRADPSPAQNQPLIEPVITAGRPAAIAGGALLTASRADPAATSPPAPTTAVSAGRPSAPGGQAVLSAPRSDVPADLPPAPAALTAAPAPRRLAGTAITTRAAADEARATPSATLVAAPVKTWAAAPAALTRSTFTGPAPVLVIRPPLVTIGVRPRLAGMAWFGHATSGAGHVCPPPTPRPDTGIMHPADTGLTLFGGAFTGRPDSGITVRPNTGLTPIC